MRAVNLLPRDSRRPRPPLRQRLPALVGAVTGVVVVAALAGGYLLESSRVADAQRGLDAARAQLAATPLPPPPPKAVPVPAAALSQQQPRLEAVAAALSQRIAWDRILREFSQVLPNDVWLTSLAMQAPGQASGAGGAGNGFTLSGSTYSYASVARLLSRLALIPDLTGVTLQSTSADGHLVQFNIAASVKGAPPPAAPAPGATSSTNATTSTGAGA